MSHGFRSLPFVAKSLKTN
ncbi:MAG: CRISPR-associated DxTHG motif protein [Chitinophagaceae bacterium]|nr:MAG: CRISPR-associated DxTHG motif protein [Chitinophagaceae bacterium]